MRAARFHSYGGPGVLTVEDAPEPHAGPAEIRIQVAATSVNPLDWKIRSGALAEVMPVGLPAIPGSDAVGVVDQVGAEVDGVWAGDLVFGLTRAGAAEFAVLPYWAPVPGTWSIEEAAAAGLVAATALAGLAPLGDLAGRTVLIEGASGGVGSAAAQCAIARGATVIGTASAANHDYLRAIGAIPLSYGEGLAERVAAITGGGVDAALDTAGSGSLAAIVALTGDPARVVTVADYGAPALGVTLADPLVDAAANLAEASRLGQAGAYVPRVGAVHDLSRITDAHAAAESGRTGGKIVVRLFPGE